MCMKNVNLSTSFASQDLSELGGSMRLGSFVNDVYAFFDDNSKKYCIKELTIATFVSAISDRDDPELNKVYDVLWTFEPYGNTEKKKGIASAILDLNKNKVKKDVNISPRSFSNQTFRLTLENYEITDLNCNYLLKVFLKEKDTGSTWEIQSINSIYVIG